MTIRKAVWIAGIILGASFLLVDRAESLEPRDSDPPNVAASFKRLLNSGTDSLTPGAEVAGEEYQLSLGLFRVGVGSTTIDVGIDYEYVRYEYANVDSRDRDLHRLQFPVRFETEFDGWRLRGYMAPGISTSSNVFKDFLNRGSSDDTFVSARAAMHRGELTSEWFVGVASDRSFGEPRIYPVAGIELMPSQSLRIRLAFPDPGFALQLSERHSLQVDVFPAGHQWRVVSDDFPRSFDYRLEALRTRLNWSVRVREHRSVDLSIGYDSGREHHFADDTGEPISLGVDSEWFVGVGIRLGATRLPRAHGAGF